MGILNVLGYSVIPFLVIIVFLVVMHELGHFITAKLAGVRVLEFGLGYPPKLWSFRFGKPRPCRPTAGERTFFVGGRALAGTHAAAGAESESVKDAEGALCTDERTEYTINLLPLGGFVRMLGEEDASDPCSLAAKPAWIRIIVLGAGAVVNLILPIILFTATFMIPQQVAVSRVIITHVSTASPAQRAGLQSGDQILSVDGDRVQNLADVANDIQLHRGQTMTFQIKRGRDILSKQVYGRWNPPQEVDPVTGARQREGPTGISLSAPDPFTKSQSYPIWQAAPKAIGATVDSLILARNQIISWVAARSTPQVAGPVGIAQATGEVAKQAGWAALLQFAALLSINLGVFNLLPLPMLDGGRIFFVLIEVLRGGKRVAPEKEALVHLIGFVVLISLVVVISYFDVARIIHGGSILR